MSCGFANISIMERRTEYPSAPRFLKIFSIIKFYNFKIGIGWKAGNEMLEVISSND